MLQQSCVLSPKRKGCRLYADLLAALYLERKRTMVRSQPSFYSMYLAPLLAPPISCLHAAQWT